MKKLFIYIIISCLLNSSNILMAQFGFLDPTFGEGGLSMVQIGYDNYSKVIFQSNGKITCTGNSFVIDRYTNDGSIDLSFGLKGRLFLTNKPGYAIGLAEFKNSNYIVTGWFVNSGSNYDILTIKTKSDGSIDSSFGKNGIVTMDIDNYDYSEAMTIQTDEKIIVVGELGKNEYDDLRIFIARFKPDGNIDSSFGENGHVVTKFDKEVACESVALQDDGKILVGGTYNLFAMQPAYYVARYNPDGSKDNSFGDQGIAQYIFGEGHGEEEWVNELTTIVVQQDGKIICGGSQGQFHGWKYDMGLVRFNTDGTLDKSYGEQGSVRIEYPGYYSEIYTMQIQTDGKLVAGANAQTLSSNDDRMLLMRFLENGHFDSGFAINGMQATMNGQFSSYCNTSCLQDDNKIILGGNSNGKFLLARFNNDNVLASNFKEVKAIQENEAITITWQTLNENNTKSYTVERSNNAKDYAGINTIPAKHAATNSYSYTDKNPLYGDNYYRIKENTANGTFTYSQTLKIVFENNNNISLYPNPAKNTVTIKGLNKNATTVIKITDMNGREISKESFSNSTSTTLSIKALAQGSYFILVEQEGRVTKLRLVKE